MLEQVEVLLKQLVSDIGFPQATELFSKLSGGKRLRARLILTIAPTHADAPLLGAIVELIHAASLLHDDVIDEAMLRRGVESVNATHGSKIAIMLGDILYSKAFSELTQFDPRIAYSIAQSVTKLSVGEMLDVEMAKNFNIDREKYLDMLYLKTATLIESCAYCAALLENKKSDGYAVYGKNLGLAFQIVDDILDIVSDEETLGKPALNDFVEGKTTLPYIDLYNALSGDEKEKLLGCHGRMLESDEKKWLFESMKKYDVIEQSYAYARELCDEAIAHVPNEDALRAIITSVIQRNH
ncbi:MAG TPA: polyprenyl synthetase family protein [Sulfuricurvum sp.]|nr:polyprenyl synthetase family protein [Sulfuricurvum sp.]